MFLWLTMWVLWALFRLRSRELEHDDPAVTTLAATAGAVLGVVFVSGNTADFLMAEVQFWIFAAFVTLLQFGQRAVPDPDSSKAPKRGMQISALAGRARLSARR